MIRNRLYLFNVIKSIIHAKSPANQGFQFCEQAELTQYWFTWRDVNYNYIIIKFVIIM